MSNLLEKASVLTTPTAYNDGKLLSVKPAPYLGSELVTNGTFDTDSDWNKQTSNWTIVNGYAVCDGLQTSNSSLFQDLAVVNGSRYRIDFTITNSLNNLNLILGATTIGQYGSGTHSVYVTKDSNASARIFFQATASNNFSGSLDNVSVKEVIDGDFDFTRNSSATRVASNGLIEDVQILSGNLVQNGDFSRESSELVTNGSFDTDSNWSKSGQVTIGGGVAYFDSDGTFTQIAQTLSGISGKSAKVVIEVTEYTQGTLKVLFSGGAQQNLPTSVGTHTLYFSNVSSNTLNIARVGGVTNIKIDNVSVKKVGQDWTLGSGWSIGDSKAVAINSASGEKIRQSGQLTANKKYKLVYDVTEITSGGFRAVVGSVLGNQVYSVGTYTEYITTTNDDFYIRTLGTTTGSVSNISVKEITDDTNLPRIDYDGFSYQDALGSELVTNGDFATDSDWSKGGNWSIGGGVATANGNSNGNISQNIPLTVGTSYSVTYTVVNASVGSRIGISTNATSIQIERTENGTYTETFTASLTSFYIRALWNNGNSVSIDNVSVKEYLGQEVVPDSGVGHILLEPQSTNTINNSNDVVKLQYSSGVTKTNNVAISPDGTFNAMGFIPTATGGLHRSGYSSNAGLYTQNDIVTLSCFVKANGYDFVAVGGFFGQEKAVFNISNGTLISQENNVINTKIVKLTNDWYRLSTTYTFQNQITNGYLYAGIYVMDSETGYAFTADGVSGVYGYGFQTELGTGTSYIPTSGSTVTRLGETLNNSGSSDLINSTEGVLYADIASLQAASGTQVFGLSDGTGVNRIGFQTTNAANQLRFVVDASGNQVSQLVILNDIKEFNKIALKWKQNDFSFWVNGVKVGDDTSGNTPPINALDTLGFYYGSGIFNFYSKVKCVAVYKEALTDEELTCLTTI